MRSRVIAWAAIRLSRSPIGRDLAVPARRTKRGLPLPPRQRRAGRRERRDGVRPGVNCAMLDTTTQPHSFPSFLARVSRPLRRLAMAVAVAAALLLALRPEIAAGRTATAPTQAGQAAPAGGSLAEAEPVPDV